MLVLFLRHRLLSFSEVQMPFYQHTKATPMEGVEGLTLLIIVILTRVIEFALFSTTENVRICVVCSLNF